jgi:hypothetical protein
MSAIATAVIMEGVKRVGAPLLKKFLTNRFGKTAGDIGEKIAERLTGAVEDRIVAQHGPIDPEKDVPTEFVDEAIRYVEDNEAVDIVELELKSQQEANRLMLAEMEKGPLWTWAWRPGWMILLGFLWFWALCLQGIVNAFLEEAIPPIDTQMLFAVTGAFLTLYMGGHTIKKFLAQKG